MSKGNDNRFRRSTAKSLSPGFVPPKNLITGKEVSWVKDAACKDMDLSVFFPETGQTIPPETREICFQCPVRTDCYIYAEKNYIDDHGVFGGYTPKQRRDLRRNSGRGSVKFKQIAA